VHPPAVLVAGLDDLYDRSMATVAPIGSSVEDVTVLTALVAELERTQRQEDVEGFLSLFDPLAVWVTGGGKRLIGIEAIGDFTRSVLPGGMSGGSVTYEIEHVLFVSADVALTGVRQTYLDIEGKPTSRGLPSYVWRRTGESWKIIAGQNTAAEDQPPT
jgi:uncharacterized protein (TIGR02246 family)